MDVFFVGVFGFTNCIFLDEKRKLGMVKHIRKQIDKFELTTDDLGLSIV